MIKLRFLSLGAGVQSTTMALMAARREIGPMPDCAIFADTGWEPAGVYRHLDWLETQLPFPVYRVSAGNIRDDLLARRTERSGNFITVPFFLKHANGKEGIGRRQCTSHYKVEPIRKKTRELLGVGPRDRIPAGSVEKWIGISVDEIIRARLSSVKFETHRFPLLESRMRRVDCLQWLRDRQYHIPSKSSCIGCPFHSNAMWREMRDSDPEAWAEACQVDAEIREPIGREFRRAEMRGQQFMHARRVPLAEVDLSTAEDRGQLNLFINDCEGMCGL
ncbi:hypothetical protein GR217_34265 [Rhizobium leguminosarum]|uniref:3'-phosphoadenosine 5'-phosphosulfate sulfotransferase (PAPS reductase)/FAD synthetase n=1 Tax=Rhizobium ruizarguesonis TaxID=2081791 RepID=A0AAE4YWU7_9HYPH|nr:hypothetical protein [Rhizobium ruizarguesonis]NEI52685.1 hypothetical protein [Rhizobium ruizarguesonis]